jgi:2-dehydropantoate 2-reductase
MVGVRAPDTPARVAHPRRISIIGAGGVGGYFAAVLARAGHTVRVLARGDHLLAIRAQGGLEVRELGAPPVVVDVGASDDPDALTGADYVILAVKTYSLDEVAPLTRRLAHGGATIVPLLNGVGLEDRLATLGVPRACVLGGLTYVSTARTAPGVVTRFTDFRRVIVGEFGGLISTRASEFVAAFAETGVNAEVTDAIEVELWRKFAFMATMAAVCGLARQPSATVREAPFGRAVMVRALREVVAVGQASGVGITDDVVVQTMRIIDGLPAGAKPSFLLDLERGGPNELDALSGTVARLAQALGVDTPIHDTAVAALSPARL